MCVGVAVLQDSLYEQSVSSCPVAAHLLLIEDTTQVSFSLSRKITGLGSVDKGQVKGFYVHPVLTLADALQIIGWYKERWNIEQLFRTLLNPTVEGKTEKSKNPYNKDSLAFAVWVVARLAGWSGYQKQRPPGPIDCLNGIKILNQQHKGYQLAKDKLTKDVYIP